MSVDVLSEITIERPPVEVAGYSADPENAPGWYVNIASVAWKTSPPLRDGSRVAFVAHFLGKRLEYIYEVTEFVSGERLVMRTAEGPFPMETTYTWKPATGGGTHMTLATAAGLPAFLAWSRLSWRSPFAEPTAKISHG